MLCCSKVQERFVVPSVGSAPAALHPSAGCGSNVSRHNAAGPRLQITPSNSSPAQTGLFSSATRTVRALLATKPALEDALHVSDWILPDQNEFGVAIAMLRKQPKYSCTLEQQNLHGEIITAPGTVIFVRNIVGTLTNVATAAGCGHHRRIFMPSLCRRLQTPKFLSCPCSRLGCALTAIAWRAVYLHLRSRH
jgi:hypothetical protein